MRRREVVPVLVVKDPCRQEHVRYQRTIASRRQFEDRFQALAQRTFDAAFECRVREDDTEIGAALAEALQPLLGFSSQDLELPEDRMSLIHPDDRAVVVMHLRRVLSGHRDLCVFRAITPTGLVRWFGVLTRPVWDAATRRITHVYGLIQDHSARSETAAAGLDTDAAYPALPHLALPSAF